MPQRGRIEEQRKLVSLRDKPRVIGLRRGSVWKWKVYTRTYAPEFSQWEVAMMVANEIAYRPEA